MYSLLAPLLGVALTVFVHAMAWRMIRPRSPARLLLPAAVAGGLLGACLTLAIVPNPGPLQSLEATLLFLPMIACYMISLPALEAESPSALIVTHVHRCGRAGATKEELAGVVNDDVFVINRIRGLEVEGLVTRRGEDLSITPAGVRFLNAFLLYHRLAGRQTLAG